VSVDAYHAITKDLLLQVAQPLSVGFEQRWENSGEIENNGIELTIASTNIQTKNFSWVTNFNISFNSNKLKNLPATFVKNGRMGDLGDLSQRRKFVRIFYAGVLRC
jgi:hypothetical protein